MSHEWSPYQEAIFKAIRESQENLVVVARAGAAKTTSLVEGLKHLPDPGSKTLLCAFNKAIQETLAERAPGYVEVKTLHSLGYGCCRQLGKVTLDKDKAYKVIKAITLDHHNTFATSDGVGKVKRLVGLAKNTMSGLVADPTDENAVLAAIGELIELAEEFDLDEEEYPADKMAEIAVEILAICQDMKSDAIRNQQGDVLLPLVDDKGNHLLDFDDMIWLPCVHELEPPHYRTVLVDELQDMNLPQLWIVKRALRAGGRFIGVGDEKQSIYRFRGAGVDVIPNMIQEFRAQVLPLPITYRCPIAVVNQVKKLVPDLEARPNAPQGLVTKCTIEHMVDQAQPGDFILSRKNAPLMGTCVALLRKYKPAVIAGRDIGKSLSDLARKSKKRTTPEMLVWLEEFLRKERERLEAQGKKRRAEYIADKVMALMILSEGCGTVEAVVNRIEHLFRDDSPTGQILCSTVHKVKGLEATRVWLLADTFSFDDPQETNIYYVACTRSAGELYMAYDPDYRKRFGRRF